MGAVLKGHDVDLGRDIAVKFILEAHLSRPGLVQRFVEEARIAGQLQHPGIVPVYELGQFPDQRLYFTMKLVEGQTLADLLAKRMTPSEDRPRFLKIFEQVCQALSYAHARGVIHRDLKPANVMVGAFGEVQVMDWGLAKVLLPQGPREDTEADQDGKPPDGSADVDWMKPSRRQGDSGATDSHTEAGCVLGTPSYMAPEQARGEVDCLDERSDVFGLGAILCEILTGQPPYVGDNEASAYDRAVCANLADAIARLDRCGADAELLRLTRRCLAPLQADRPRNASDLCVELIEYLNSVEQRLRQAELASAEARAREQEERRHRELTVAAQKEMQRTLTRQVAERLEGELSRLEMVGHSLATLVVQREDWEEAQLVGWMNAMLQREDRIFGLCVAFEPGQFRPDLEDYGLYQFRGGPEGELRTKYLRPPAYPYRDLDWYRQALEAGDARWTEPFLDAEGGDIPMVCYTVPFYRGGEIAGVITVDLSVRYFERLGEWLSELDFGQRSYEFVISRAGLFISHPLPEFDFATLAAADKPPRSITEPGAANEDFLELTRRMLREETGSGTAVDPSTGRPATWLFGRVRPAGWTFVAVVEEGRASP